MKNIGLVLEQLKNATPEQAAAYREQYIASKRMCDEIDIDNVLHIAGFITADELDQRGLALIDELEKLDAQAQEKGLDKLGLVKVRTVSNLRELYEEEQ